MAVIIRVPMVIRNGRYEELRPGEKLPNCFETKRFNFTEPSTEWLVEHNLDKHPSVTIVDAAGKQVCAEVSYVDTNKILVKFTRPFVGAVLIN